MFIEIVYLYAVKGRATVPTFGPLVLADSDVRRLDRSGGAVVFLDTILNGRENEFVGDRIDFVTAKAPTLTRFN